MPTLHTLAKVPEELTLHEAPMFPSEGIEYVSGDTWGEIDTCLGALAVKAAEQGHGLEFVLTMGAFGGAQREPMFRSKLPMFTQQGTLTVLPGRLTYSHSRGPF